MGFCHLRRPVAVAVIPINSAINLLLDLPTPTFHFPIRLLSLLSSHSVLPHPDPSVHSVTKGLWQSASLSTQFLSVSSQLTPLPPASDIMADDAPTTEEAPITFSVKASNDAKFTLTLPTSTTVSELKNRLSTSEYADTPAERQRLIYSGRVLKDNDTLATYKIKDGHTIHLVKSAASNQRQAPTAQSASATPGDNANQAIPGVPTNIAAGTGNNPLAGLTGARYAGFAQLPGAGMFGPDGGVSPSITCAYGFESSS
jgi:uncharacterized ubiquitin-like protein YukD